MDLGEAKSAIADLQVGQRVGLKMPSKGDGSTRPISYNNSSGGMDIF